MEDRIEVTMNIKSFDDLKDYALSIPTLHAVFESVTDENIYKQGRGTRVRLSVDHNGHLDLIHGAQEMLTEAENEFRNASTAGESHGKRVAREKIRRFTKLHERLSAL